MTRIPRGILIATALLLTEQATAEVKDVFHLTEAIETKAGEIPPCTPLQLASGDLQGKNVRLEDLRHHWSKFKVPRTLLDKNSYPTLAGCVSNTPRYSEHYPFDLITSFDGETLAVGMPSEFADMMLGPHEILEFERPSATSQRQWSSPRGRSSGSLVFAGSRSAPLQRLRDAQSVHVTLGDHGTIETIAFAEYRNAKTHPLILAEDDHDRHTEATTLYEQQDPAAAFEIWLSLAESDYSPAQYSVADLYYRGEGVEQNLEQAVHWFQQAADGKDRRAQYELGLLYATGECIPGDLAQAYHWLSEADRLGHEQAAEAKDQVAQRMRPEELELAEALAKKRIVTNPVQLSKTEPEYPALAEMARMDGRVILQATIDTEGRVNDPNVLSCTRRGVGFEIASIQSVLGWKYHPALQDGEPVSVYFTIVVTFNIK